MTLLMTQVAPRVLPEAMLPSTPVPVRAVRWAVRRTERLQLSSAEAQRVALVGHLLFSAGAGSAFALLRASSRRLSALPTPAAGALFGLGLWAATFETALPALGVMRPTTVHAPVRWPAPLVGHAVYGAVTAVVARAAHRRLRR
jgi:uncharacterized membrane protein YagU involved in acid resistance